MKKAAILRQIVEALRDKLTVVENAKQMANEEALPSEGLSESQREPRALEASFLIDGQSRLANTHKEELLAFEAITPRDFDEGEPVALGAVVKVQTGRERSLYFVGPRAGGLEVRVDGTNVMVITPSSPLGRVLIGRNQGETVAVDDAQAGRSVQILSVS